MRTSDIDISLTPRLKRASTQKTYCAPFNFSLHSEASSNEKEEDYRDGCHGDTELSGVSLQHKDEQLETFISN